MSNTTHSTQSWPEHGRHYRWYVLGVSFLFQGIIFGLTYYCLTFWITPWMDEFGVSRSQVLVIFILLQVGMGIGGPFAGRAIDRFSIRWLVVTGIVCYASALALSAMATDFWLILVCYATLVVIGNLLAGNLPAQALAIRWFPYNRGTALGVVSIGTSFGGLVLPPVIAWLIGQYGWRETNLMLAVAVPLFFIPLVLGIIRNRPAHFVHQPDPSVDAADHTIMDSRRWTTGEILREPSFWLLALAITPVGAAFASFGQNVAPLATDLELSTGLAASLVSVMAAVMIGSKFFFGLLADRIDHRYLLWMASGFAMTGFLMLTVIDSPGYPTMVFVSALLGFSSGSILPLMGASVSSRFGARSFGHVSGLLGLVMVASSTGPWMTAYIRDVWGSYSVAWLPLTGMLVLSMVATGFIPKNPATRQA